MDAEKKKQRGRPALPAEQKRSKNLTFRIRDGMKQRLERAAAPADRSISEEIEHRLEMSFAQGDDSLSKALVGNSDTSANLIRWIAFQMQCQPGWENGDATKRAMVAHITNYLRETILFELQETEQ